MDCVGCDKCKLWGKLQVGWCCSLDFVTGEIVSARGVSPNLQKGTDDSFWGRYMTDQWKFCHGLGCVAICWHWQEHPRLHWNVRHCIVRWGLSSATINSLHDSVHPPDMEINPPVTDSTWPPMGSGNHTIPSPYGIDLSQPSKIILWPCGISAIKHTRQLWPSEP